MASDRLVSADHYRGIGEVAATWARLEAHMFRALQALTGLSRLAAMALFWDMQFRQRLSRMQVLAAIRWGSEADLRRVELEQLVNRMETSCFIRNIVVHSFWRRGRTPNSIRPFYINARGTGMPHNTNRKHFPTLQDRDFTPERLHTEALTIYQLAEDLKLFVSRHLGVKFLHEDEGEPLD